MFPPFQIHKRSVVVRYMFFDRDDINWYKPIELRTKWGRKGKIKETLGKLLQNPTIKDLLYFYVKLLVALLNALQCKSGKFEPHYNRGIFQAHTVT